jgi:hypothetical protein
MQTYWFASLICAVCLEGLGRRYLAFIPSVFFYFLKDVILIAGYIRFRPSRPIQQTARYLFRGFEVVTAIGVLWTFAEIFNPEQQSFLLGFIGLRSYWLWWLAPMIIAGVLQEREQKERAIYALVALCGCIAMLAAVQFAAPPDADVNMYSVWNGEEIYSAGSAVVTSTGRARVASTFAFVTGFVDFTILVPALLLSLGLDAENPSVRRAALFGTFATASVVPMSGSRSSVVMGVAILGLTLWTAGLFFTRVGRRVLIGAAVAATLSAVVFPEALEGVQSRFEDKEETNSRFEQLETLFPPVAIALHDYPFLGAGTGMQQNARATFRISTQWDVETEVGRYLVELGPIGFLLIWLSKLGLMTALLRSYKILKRGGRRGSAAAALSYGALTIVGNLGFDHNWQALYFVGCGFILAEVVNVRKRAAAAAPPETAVAPTAIAVQHEAA